VWEKGKGCVCWEARDVCVLGSHEGRARERRRQGMRVGEGRRARDGQGSKALKGEVVQGIGHHGRKRSGKEGMCIGKKREVVEKGRDVLGGAQGRVRSN
jgi:hypothetical protein